MNVFHSSDSPEWYTPAGIVSRAREVLGSIDLDPASHPEANARIKAARFYTAQENGLVQPWPEDGTIFLNPPGGLVNEFWRAFIVKPFVAGIWVGFNLQQLQTLQSGCPGYPQPMDFPICIPDRRLAFTENKAKKKAREQKLRAAGKTVKDRSSPAHANYIVYVGDNPDRFRHFFGALGKVWIP